MTIDEAAKELVNREVHYCVSNLIDVLSRVEEFQDDEDLINLLHPIYDHKSAAIDEGYKLYNNFDGEFICLRESDIEEKIKEQVDWKIADEEESSPNGVICKKRIQEIQEDYSEYDAIEDICLNIDASKNEQDAWFMCCEENCITPYEIEVLEHWLVSDYLGRKLTEVGESVVEFLGLTIWARCTSGQAIYSDSCIREIAKQIYD